MTQIPSYLNSLFWDVNVGTFDPFKYPRYTISRILELGNERAVKWMRDNFSEDDIKDIITIERSLSRKSANFWAIIYRIPATSVMVLGQTDAVTSGVRP